MGNFYSNITVKGSTKDAVISELKVLKRKAFVTLAINNFIVIYDAECEEQVPRVLSQLSVDLSKSLKCPLISFMNHDDDILIFEVYKDGILIDEYNSCPGYFEGEETPPQGGDAGKICVTFGLTRDQYDIETILRSQNYTFAFERHEALAKSIGLPLLSVGYGYN